MQCHLRYIIASVTLYKTTFTIFPPNKLLLFADTAIEYFYRQVYGIYNENIRLFLIIKRTRI
jgi:hypothetical protein